MPKVTQSAPGTLVAIASALVLSVPACAALRSDPFPADQPQPAKALYLALGDVGLDKSRVYEVREASIDRPALHITLDDGTIAFTQDVFGHVTGAFFEGEGEVLVTPPDRVERSSMVLFTGGAILEERFSTAYLRFNDDTFREFEDSLRAADQPNEFVTLWDAAARDLAKADALRLLLTFSQFLPRSGSHAVEAPRPAEPGDRFLHARLQGRTLGGFDVYYDSTAREQVWAGQLKVTEGKDFYDSWTSFSAPEKTAPAGRTTLAGGRENDIGVTAYVIRAEVSPPTGLSVDASVEIRIHRGGERAALFELSRFLVITRVDLDGEPVEFIHNPALVGTDLARRGDDLVGIVFPEPLPAGRTVTLHFSYAGDVLSDAGGGLLYVGARGNWYPRLGLTMASFDLRFRYPAGWTLVATGKKVDDPNRAGAEQVSRWVSERPVPLAGFNLGKYTRAVARAGSVGVESYAAFSMERGFPKPADDRTQPTPGWLGRLRGRLVVPLPSPPPAPPSPAGYVQAVAEQSAGAIEFFARRFGPFPYASLKLAQMPGTLSQGWPGLVFLSSFSFLSDTDKSDLQSEPVERTLSDMVVAHETAHQWWGDLVSWDSYRDAWITEALANYSALLLLEAKKPAQFRAVLEKYRNDLLAKQPDGSPVLAAGPVTLGTRLSSSHSPTGYEVITYGRGTWLLHMLRSLMAEDRARDANPAQASSTSDPFLRALRHLREQYQGERMSSRQFLEALEEELPRSACYEGKKSLDWFYEGWIEGSAIPRLELDKVRYVDAPGRTTVSGVIVQIDSPEQLVTPVPVYAVVERKTVRLGRVFAEGGETSFRLSAPEGTRKIVLDPDHTLLTRLH